MDADRTRQYTIRGIPPDVDAALRRKAHRRKVSLNRLLVEELIQASGSRAQQKLRSLEGIAGRWQEDTEFDQVLTEQRRVDQDLWK